VLTAQTGDATIIKSAKGHEGRTDISKCEYNAVMMGNPTKQMSFCLFV
jgi:hypothetical protein